MSNSLVPSRPAAGSTSHGELRTPLPRRRAAPPDSPDGPPIDLAKVVLALRRRWWLVVLCVGAAGGLAWWWARQQPTVYTARAVVQLVNTGRELAGKLVSEDEPTMDVSLLSQLEILGSRAVAGHVVDSVPLALRVRTSGFPLAAIADLALADSSTTAYVNLAFGEEDVTVVVDDDSTRVPYGAPVTAGGASFVVAARPPGAEVGTLVVLTRERAIDVALAGLDAGPRGSTAVVDITFTADDPVTARRVVNTWVHAYQDVDARLARQQTQRRRQFIEQQLSEVDAQLAAAERTLNTFRTRQQAYSAQEKFATQRRELAQLEVQRQQLDADRRLATTLLGQLESSDAGERTRALRMLASSDAGGSPVVSRLYGQLVDYESARAELVSGPGGKAAGHPEVQRLDTLIAATRRQLVDAVRAHVDLIGARVASIDDVRTSTTRELSALPVAEAEETRLSQNADALRQQATMLRSEYQQVRIAEAASVGKVDIVDLAMRALPIQPQSDRVIAFALFLGALFGAAAAVGLELLDRSVKTRTEVEMRIGLPLLATVPRMQTVGKRRFARLRMPRTKQGGDGEDRRSVALTAARETRAPSSEAFRQLRTNLLFSASRSGLRTLLVTSANESEGKTSVAANLATTFAQQNLRVLIIDCDLLASRQHRLFKLPLGPGLQQVLLEGVHPTEAVQRTSVPGLFLMSAGTPVDGDALGSQRMRALMRDLSQDFDVIILDSAPVLAVSDSVVIGGSVDAVLLVLKAGATDVASAIEATRHLDAVGANLAGAVLNDPDERLRRYGGRYYAYGYGYPKRELAGV